MAFWTSEKLKERAGKETLILPYYEKHIKHGAYELSLGKEAFVTSEDNKKKQILGDGEHLVIPAGQLALLITQEEIQIPPDAIGFISIKAGIKFRGLVNVSGFHVDPGFSGKLKFSVYNAGSGDTVLSNGQSVFLLWFCDLDRKTDDTYKGEHADQKEITSQDVMKLQGKVHSPAALDKRLTSLEHAVAVIKWISITLFVASITGVIGYFTKSTLDVWRASVPPPVSEGRPLEGPSTKNAVISPETKPQTQSTSPPVVNEQINKESGTKKAETSEGLSKSTSSKVQDGEVKEKSSNQRRDGEQSK